jgi:hypothetical protein
MPRTTKSSSPGEDPAEDAAAELEAVAIAVEDALPGVQVVDRALELDDGARADLAGIDATGRMVLVRIAGEDPDRAALDVLDLITFVRSHTALARHLGAPRSAGSLAPRVVVILEPRDRVLAARLDAVSGAGLELYDLRTVKSAAGERAYLVARAGGGVAGGGKSAPTLQRFLDALPPEREELGRELCARLTRLDDELRTEASADAVSWYFRDRQLVRLESRSGRLSGVVGGVGRPHDVDARRDADELLEAALSRLMEEVGRDDADAPGRDGSPGGSGSRHEPPEGELALLTPDEIEAFRD